MEISGPVIEPVQLQVVSRRLWDQLPEGTAQICIEDIDEVGDVDKALGDFYADIVKNVSSDTHERERAIRNWFGSELISSSGLRGQVMEDAQRSRGLSNTAIRKFEDAHLVRAEERRGVTWFELAHDRLVDPIRGNNSTWFEAHLVFLQRQAAEWEKLDRPDDVLLRGEALRQGQAWAETHPEEMEAVDQHYLEASQLLAAEEERRRKEQAQRLEYERQRAEEQAHSAARFRRLAIGTALVAAIALLMMSLALLFFQEANRQKTTSQANAIVAETARGEAIEQKGTAQANAAVAATARVEADLQKATAVFNAGIAHNRDLASQALSQLGIRQDRALLFGLETAYGANTSSIKDILFKVLQYSPHLEKILYGHSKSVFSVAFSPDGKTLASGSEDNTIRLWDVTDMKNVKPILDPLKGHSDIVTSLAFSPDGKTLASGSKDKTIRLWDVASGQPVGDPLKGHTEWVYSVAFSPDGKTLASGSYDKTIRLFDLDFQSWLVRACRIVGRNFTMSEWTTYFPGEDYRQTCQEYPRGP